MSGPVKYQIKILDKLFAILGLFNEKGQSLSSKEISVALGYNKSTTYRIIRNLEESAYLQRDSNTNKYRLGFAIHRLGSFAESYGHIRHLAHPILMQLNEKCDETVHLAVLQKGQALYVDKIDSKRRVMQIISKIGAKLPCHCSAVGKVLLTSMTESELDIVIAECGLKKLTKNTITNAEQLKEEIRVIRERGYSTDNEEIEYGLKCIAAPILGDDDKIVAAVSISAPKERFDYESDNFRTHLSATAAEISLRLKI